MKNKTLYITAIFSFTLLASCNNPPKADKPQQPPRETPEALKNESGELDISSYKRGSGNLVDELYQELVDKTPDLKKLEDQLNDNPRASNQITEKFTDYNTKSTNYYNAAKQKAHAISDTILRQQVLAFIESSNNQYINKTKELNALCAQISDNNTSLYDHHLMLKIFLTLPLIQDYQNNNLPYKKEFVGFIQAQQQLINKINSTIPKH